MHVLSSEMLKYKRTLTGKLIVWIPLFFTVFAMAVRMLLPGYFQNWKGILTLVFNWWPVLFLPMGYGLFAGLVALQEKKSGNYFRLKAQAVPGAVLWIGKIAAMAVISFLSTLILIFSVLMCGLLSGSGAAPIGKIWEASFLCWLVSLTLIPIQLWAAVWKGILFSIGVGFAGMLIGVLAAQETGWIVVPWSWATRLMCPVVGVHPNGTLLPAGSPFLDEKILLPGVLMSLSVFLVLGAGTALWFQRRDVR